MPASSTKPAASPARRCARRREMGLLGIAVSEKYGGAGMDHIAYTHRDGGNRPRLQLRRRGSSRCKIPSTGASIEHFGTEEQKNKILRALRARRKDRLLRAHRAAGRLERGGARPNQGGVRGRRSLRHQRREGLDHQRRRGRCCRRVCEHAAGEGRKGNHRAPGGKRHAGIFSVGKEEKKLGIHATACCPLSFADCEVPTENRIGNEGEGYKIALATLDGGRIGQSQSARPSALRAVAYEASLWHTPRSARQFSATRSPDFEAIQFMLADMAMEIDAARLLARRAAWKQDTGARFSLEAAIAKLFSSRDGHARRAQSHPDPRSAATATVVNIPSSCALSRRAHHRNLRRHLARLPEDW